MITTPYAQVTPEQELARLTLISSDSEEFIRRQSVLGGHRLSLGEINGQAVQGPVLPYSASIGGNDVDISKGSSRTDANGHSTDRDDDTSSEATLVGTPVADLPAQKLKDSGPMNTDFRQSQQQEGLLEDKENLPPYKVEETHTSTPESKLHFLGEPSSSRVTEQMTTSSTRPTISGEPGDSLMANKDPSNLPLPPDRPPPVPPRQKPDEQKTAIQEEVEYGAQQDVTEVIANVLFQLQCAIKPESADESGEQIDKVKRLFFGKQKSYTTNEQGASRTKEEYISDIKIDVASGPRDIYAALDGAFDVQEVEVGGTMEPQYTTISQLPPVLQILVQRVQFDAKKKTAFKSTHHLDFKETIYLDRYMDSVDSELLQRRQECWKWKKDLAALEARKAELATTEVRPHWFMYKC